MTKRITFIKIAILAAALIASNFAAHAQTLRLLPTPQQVIKQEGKFQMNEMVPVFLDKKSSTEESQAVWLFCESYFEAFGKELTVADNKKVEKAIYLRNLSLETPKKGADKEILPVGNQGYQIRISSQKIEILANGNAGLYYGSQTLIQILKMTSLFGSIDCMTVNDMPDFEKRGWKYSSPADRTPDYDFLRELIKQASHYKINVIDFSEDHFVRSLAETEFFFLQKYAETYFVTLIVDASQKADYLEISVDDKDAIHPPFHRSAASLNAAFSNLEIDKAIVAFPEPEIIFMENWYSVLWSAELLWRPIKTDSKTVLEQRIAQFDQAVNVQFFGTDFPLIEKMQAIDSLPTRALTYQDFWQAMAPENAHNAAGATFHPEMLEEISAIEESLSFVAEEYAVKNETAVLLEIFALQQMEFIVEKEALAAALHRRQARDLIIEKELFKLLEILEENLRHLQNGHAALFKIENSSEFPERLKQKYDKLFREISEIRNGVVKN